MLQTKHYFLSFSTDQHYIQYYRGIIDIVGAFMVKNELISRFDCCIYLISFAPPVFEQFGRETGLPFGEHCIILNGTTAEEWMDTDAHRACTNIILERELKNPGHLKRTILAHEKKKNTYIEFFNNIDQLNLQELNTEELLGSLGTFLQLYYNQYASALLPLFYKEPLSDMIFKKLSERFGEKTSEIIAYVTTPEKDSFAYNERESMLKLMMDVYDSIGGEIFDKDPEAILALLESEYNDLHLQLIGHSKRFFWINNNYRRVIILSPLDFIKKMKYESLSFEHPKDELAIMEHTKQHALEKKKEYLQLIDKEEKCMVSLLSDGGWWQDERKKCNLIGNHILMKFLWEVSRRTSIPEDILKNASVNEMGTILYGHADIESIKDRHKKYFTLYCKWQNTYSEMGQIELRRYVENNNIEHVSEFRGMTASLGNAQGEVVIITKEEDFSKMKSGAILVAAMTWPEYTHLMRHASAVITDEGGLTCHAAIVSREFKIPCIVGTKIATRVLKDGDIVEINSTTGLIKVKRK